jgi:hypothetical protein
MAFGKVNCIAETHHLAQKIRPMTEAFENARHLLPAGLAPPLVVDLGNVAGRVRVFDEADLCFWMSHGLQQSLRSLQESSTSLVLDTAIECLAWASEKAKARPAGHHLYE